MSNEASSPAFKKILREEYASGKHRDSGSVLRATWQRFRSEHPQWHERSGAEQKQRAAIKGSFRNPFGGFKSRPGKFEGERYLTQRLYGDGFFDEEIGSVDELGWFGKIQSKVKGRIIYAIISEDSQGFVYGQYFGSQKDLDRKWSAIEREYEKFDNADEGDE